MILSNNFIDRQKGAYKATIESLEKAKEILNKRYNNKEISDIEYIKKSEEINAQIRKYKQLLGEY